MTVDFTTRLLRDAGIAPGMKVLDVGCGGGAVSSLLAELVGTTGQVIGIDKDSRALRIAREQAKILGLSNVRFQKGDFDTFSATPNFDAVVGRRVLMYQPDAVPPLQHLFKALRPNGLVIFQEHDSATVQPLSSDFPRHEQVRAWIWETVKREGADTHIGLSLSTALAKAGFTVEEVRAEAILVTPTMHHPAATIVRSMLPRITKHGVATEQQIDIETLDQRLTEERQKANTTFVWELIFGAWARKPA